MTEARANNPLVQKFSTPFGAVPFDQIRTEDFLPALEKGLETARGRLLELRASQSPPTFDNTILALEALSEEADLVAEVYFNLLHAHGDDALHALAKEISPRLSEFSNDISLDEKIFARVEAVYQGLEKSALNAEERRLVEKSYLSFVRNGARLQGADKERLREIDRELSKLRPQYSENVLKATNAFSLEITDAADLKGLPDSAVEAAAVTARERGREGVWVFTLDAPSYVPFMTYSENRTLREKMFRAFRSRCLSGELDNRPVLLRMAQLRFERAQLLGYADHASYVLEERMAENPARVRSFLNHLVEKAKPAAEKELRALAKLLEADKGTADLRPWDVGFYAEKLKSQQYQFDEEELRPYFPLENVISGIFEHARKLYGLTFRPNGSVPVYHPDVKVYEVIEEKSGKFIGLFYADFFPRPTKSGGAWMTALREQGRFQGELRRPHVAIVCNFTKPTPTKPSLLSYDEVRTFFHEFGHALHGLLSECTFRSLAGTNVYQDFVELPSQIMENWVEEKEGLDLFAKHYQTSAPLPAALAKKIKDSATFMAGNDTLTQLVYGTIDMAWHTGKPQIEAAGVEEFEKQALKPLQILPRAEGTCISASFSHIFPGGYSAGYYSYKWAEVLSADSFELFAEQGIFNAEVAARFRQNILSRGGSAHPMELYKAFRGREPDPDALLRKAGLLAS